MAQETMTGKEILKMLQQDYNNYQIYRKNNKQAYELATQEDIIEFGKHVMSKEEATQLAKCYHFQRKMHKRLGYFIRVRKNLQGMQETMKGGEQ